MKKNIAAGIATALAGITPALAMSGCNQGQVEEELQFTLGDSKTFECSVTPIVSKESDAVNQLSAEYSFTLEGCKINKEVEGSWKASAKIVIKDDNDSEEYDLDGTVVIDGLDATVVLKTKILLVEDNDPKFDSTDKTSLPFAKPGTYQITNLSIKHDKETLLSEKSGFNANIGVNFLALHDPEASDSVKSNVLVDWNDGSINIAKNSGHGNYVWFRFGAFWALNMPYDEPYDSENYIADVEIVNKPSIISEMKEVTFDDLTSYSLGGLSFIVAGYFDDTEPTTTEYDGDYDVNIKITDSADDSIVYFDSTKDEDAPEYIYRYRKTPI